MSPVRDKPGQLFHLQDRFDGGMVDTSEPGPNQFRYGLNGVIRDGDFTTRPGIRRAWPSLSSGFRFSVFFNQDDARYNDATHTGFWFPFRFVEDIYGDVQGWGFYRFPDETEYSVILCTGGAVYKHERSGVEEITTAEAIDGTETVDFLMANQYVVMLRGEDENPLYWDGSSTGFIAFPAPTASGSSAIQGSGHGVYLNGRLYLVRDRDDIRASDVLDITSYHETFQKFSVGKGDGDEIVRLLPFQEDNLLVFKKRSVHVLSGLNLPLLVDSSGDEQVNMSDNVRVDLVDGNNGLVGENAAIAWGEEVFYLSERGIIALRRNEQAKLQAIDLPLSHPITKLIKRIHWTSASVACAGAFDNYILISAPIDGKTYNNGTIVYDTIANGGTGAWCGLWQSEMLKPVEWLRHGEHLYFLGNDGILREAMTDDPWDTEDPYLDVQTYNAATYYFAGEHVYFEVSGEQRIYVADVDTEGNAPTDTDYWTQVTDPYNAFHVESELVMRDVDFGDPSPKKPGRFELLFGHQNPKLTIEVESEDSNTRSALFSDQEFDRTEYDVADTDDWEPTNSNDDWDTAHRKDYSIFVPGTGSELLADPGLDAPTGIWSILNGSFEDGYASLSIGATSRLSCGLGTLTVGLTYEYEVSVYVFLGPLVTAHVGAASAGFANVAFTNTGVITGTFIATAATGTLEIEISDHGSSVATWIYRASVKPRGHLNMSSDGLYLNTWEHHTRRWIKPLLDNRKFRHRITNTQGKLAIKSLMGVAEPLRFAGRKR